MKHISILLVISAFNVVGIASTPNTNPKPAPTATPKSESPMKAEKEGRRKGWEFGTGLAELIENRNKAPENIRQAIKEDRQLISIHPDDKAKFRNFLKTSNSGIVRVYDIDGCGKSECPKFMPSRASSYSFRNANYRSHTLSELGYENKLVKLVGMNTLGFLTSLGEMPVEKVSLNSPGILEMAKFEPSSDMSIVEKQYLVAKNGFQIGDHIYKTELPVKIGNTYAMRAIAYKADLPKQIKGFYRKVLEKDKKKDTLVVFRVIRKHSNGSISLLWRVLASKDSPKLGFRAPTKPKLKKN